jgi:hypothetical protein
MLLFNLLWVFIFFGVFASSSTSPEPPAIPPPITLSQNATPKDDCCPVTPANPYFNLKVTPLPFGEPQYFCILNPVGRNFFTFRDLIIDSLSKLTLPNDQFTDKSNLLKAYAKANANLFYSPNLIIVEKSFVISVLLKELLEKDPVIKGVKDLVYNASVCGRSLGEINRRFERHFPDEVSDFEGFLRSASLSGTNINQIFNHIIEYLDTGSKDDQKIRALDPERADKILSDADALRTSHLNSFDDIERLFSHYENLVNPFQASLAMDDPTFKAFVQNYLLYLLFEFYKQTFSTSQEIYKALFGTDLDLNGQDGKFLPDSVDLAKIFGELATEYLGYTKRLFPSKFADTEIDTLLLSIKDSFNFEAHKTPLPDPVIDPSSYQGASLLVEEPVPIRPTPKTPIIQPIPTKPSLPAQQPPGHDYWKIAAISIIVFVFALLAIVIILLLNRKRSVVNQV